MENRLTKRNDKHFTECDLCKERTERCGLMDCTTRRDIYRHYIRDLNGFCEKEHKERLIDINSVPCTKIKVGDWTCEVFTKDDVVKARTVEIPPVKEGKWQYWTDDRKDYAECPICEYGSEGELLYKDITPYCPYCGAKLVVDEELYKSVKALDEG